MPLSRGSNGGILRLNRRARQAPDNVRVTPPQPVKQPGLNPSLLNQTMFQEAIAAIEAFNAEKLTLHGVWELLE